MNVHEQQLNELARKYLDEFDLSKITPIRQYYDSTVNGVTVVPTGVDAFNLKPAASGKLYSHTIVKGQEIPSELLNPKELIAIHRSILGYRWASDCLKNESKFQFDIIHYINVALIELQDKLGDLSKYDLVMYRSGQQKEYFRDIENSAGYDFRIAVMRKD